MSSDGNINEFGGTEAGLRLPNWAPRELTGNYFDEVQKRAGIDIPFLLLTLLILMIGVIMVLSASFASAYYSMGQPTWFFIRQFVFAVSGVAIMLLTSRVRISTMSRWSMHLLLAALALLVAVLVIGISVNGAKRWIGIGTGGGAFTFQPSEIAKVAVVMAYAQMMCKFGNKMKTFKYGVLPFVLITGVIVLLLYRQPHLSASIIVLAITAIMMFAGGTRLRYFVLALLIAALAAGAVLYPHLRAQAADEAVQEISVKSAVLEASGNLGYAGRRVGAWLDPDADPLGDGFQIRQSLIAVGAGGMFGQGLGQSRQKYLYLPEEHNDYIFAIVSEELGFIGAMLILMLFMLLIIRGFWLALHARDKYAKSITIGIVSLLAIQVVLNVAVVLNLAPATGISLPFFSYGGTALWIQLLQMGIILAVSREIPREPKAGNGN